MKVDRARLYDSSIDFFELNGSVVMKLTPNAAQDVCNKALEHGLVVVRIEGGYGTILALKPALIVYGMVLIRQYPKLKRR